MFSQELIKKSKSIKADLYIGHNLGALPTIVKAQKLHKAKSIFDFEDFHRGELTIGCWQQNAIKSVEDKYVPFVNGISASSSLIAETYEKLYRDKKIITLNNVFPSSYSVKELPSIPIKPLKLFWFSQYIGKKRGLETILKAMANFKHNEISLTLLGKLSDEMENYFKHQILTLGLKTEQVVFMDPIIESSIPEFASSHHIGICAEFVYNENRDLCLTNKLFMYLMSGNALLLSNTRSQQDFFNNNPSIGQLFEQESHESLAKALQLYIDHPDILYQHMFNAWNLGNNKLNWENEKPIFISHVTNALKCD